MIEAIRFQNYRVLRDALLPLAPFTLIVGPNGSGKSTILHALRSVRALEGRGTIPHIETVSSLASSENQTSVELTWGGAFRGLVSTALWKGSHRNLSHDSGERSASGEEYGQLHTILWSLRTYSLNENAIVAPVQLDPSIELQEDGGKLAGVLDRMRDQQPENFELLNQELSNLLPEFDRILFETPSSGTRGFRLRTRIGQHAVRASDLSQGTVLALAILTLAYLEKPPLIVCIEEPDRGVHPRLYRDVRDALYRLSYPESFGLDRSPVQVIVTTHSPYMLDLHREHPEEIVIAQKHGSEGKFERLVDREDLEELLSEASLGEIWYSGVLGGVPAGA